MPVFVRWEWKEKTNTFLVIFYFYDDYSKKNLRLRKANFDKDLNVIIPSTTEEGNKSILTWAPAHYETGLLLDILGYANILNGLTRNMTETNKAKLRDEIESPIEAIWVENKVPRAESISGVDEGEGFMAVVRIMSIILMKC